MMKSKKNYFLEPLLFVILLNIFFNFLDFRIDLTEDKKHSLSLETMQMLKDLDDKIFIKVYLDGMFPPEFNLLQSELFNLLNSMKKIANDNFDYEFINPNLESDDLEKNKLFKQLVNYGLTPTDIETRSASTKSNQIIFPGALIFYKDNQKAVNFLKNSTAKNASKNINSSIEHLEYEFMSTIYNLTKNKTEKIAFLEGNGELNSMQVYDICESVLQNNDRLSYHYKIERFKIKEFEIDSTTMQANISKKISDLAKFKVLIIANPTKSFNILDKFIIDQYLMKGGKLLWLIDGVTASMDSLKSSNSFIAFKNNLNIDDQLFKYGVRINSDIIEDLRSTKIPVVTGYSNNIPQQSYFSWPYYPLLFSKNNHPISKGIDALKCSFASSIDTIKNNIKKTILLSSSSQSRLSQAPTKISLSILQNPPPKKTFNKSNLPIAVLLEGNFESVFNNRILPKNQLINFTSKSKKTQMIVISDGDIIKNNLSKNGDIYPLGYDKFIKFTYEGNKKFINNAIHYLCDDIGLTKLKSKEFKLRLLDKQKVSFYNNHIIILNILFPSILIIISTLFFLKFKLKKYA